MSAYDDAVKKLAQDRAERAKKGLAPWQLYAEDDPDWNVDPGLVEALAKDDEQSSDKPAT
jgi:hypothetical protein